MRVLHLASFTGNIGDNANHSGFKKWFERTATEAVEWKELEIREFYWRERRFDETFVRLANEVDLLVIGGGNYFELWVDRSQTGTSVDIALELFRQIATPVFFNALGCDEGQGVTEGSVRKFNAFMSLLAADTRYLVTVRNDGALATMRKYLPTFVVRGVRAIPDHGFFLEYDADVRERLVLQPIAVAINLACDMPEHRFAAFGEGRSGYGSFCDEFAAMLKSLADAVPDAGFVFFPHVYGDLKVIADVIGRLADRLRRTRVATAPYVTGAAGARRQFGLYKQCDLVLGTRFHSNVCALGMGIPAIGLYNYSQIRLLYEELGMPDRSIPVGRPGFSIPLRDAAVAALSGLAEQRARSRDALERVVAARAEFEPALRKWLKDNVGRRAS